MLNTSKFYITTPIYYVNDRPHIGHIYTTTIADIIARYHRLIGDDVFFLTGTDEHGKKVADAARSQEISPQTFVDGVSGKFQETFTQLKMTNNDFIRTTEPRHEQSVRKYVRQLLETGDVYFGEYEGWYDFAQEEYVTDTNAREQEYKSAISGKPLIRIKEKNYFFRLSKYADRLLTHIDQNPSFVQPDARRNEVLGRIRDGLNDVAISRTTEPWGVSMPGDAQHSIYVWIDALFNYRTAIDTDSRLSYWPAEVHLIGKEILWFHAVIWPAVLMAIDWPLPKQIYAHSFWISEGQKMSKSLGNFIDLEKIDEYIAQFSLDALRYYLATQGPLSATDADFAHDKFVDVYNADLANTLGNCLSRICKMTYRYSNGVLSGSGYAKSKLTDAAAMACVSFQKKLNVLDLTTAIQQAVGLVRMIDSYIEETKPFKLAKEKKNLPEVNIILYNCAEAMRIASLLLWPVVPDKAEEIWRRLGCDEYSRRLADRGRGELEVWWQWGSLKPGTQILEGDPLFPRYQTK